MSGFVLLAWVLVIGSTIWVYADASAIAREQSRVAPSIISPGSWAAGVFLLWIVGFPLYLAKRGAWLRMSDADIAAAADARHVAVEAADNFDSFH